MKIFSQENEFDPDLIVEVNLIEVFRFQSGSEDGQLGFESMESQLRYDPAPTGIVFDADDNLIVLDFLNERIVKFTSDFQFVSSFNNPEVEGAKWFGYLASNNIFTSLEDYGDLQILSTNGKQIVEPLTNISFYADLFFLNDFIFFFDNRRNLTVYDIVKSTFHNIEDLTLSEFPEVVDALEQNNLRLNSDRFLVEDTNVYTRNYKFFIDYWTDFQDENNLVKPYNSFRFNEDSQTISMYLGKDKYGRTYWSRRNKYISVFDENGWCIKTIKFPWVNTVPAITSEGQIFAFEYFKEDDLVLYEIPIW
jgi:hypothetical protein